MAGDVVGVLLGVPVAVLEDLGVFGGKKKCRGCSLLSCFCA